MIQQVKIKKITTAKEVWIPGLNYSIALTIMIGQMAIAMTLPEFNDPRSSVTPIFILIWIIFCTDFLRIAKK